MLPETLTSKVEPRSPVVTDPGLNEVVTPAGTPLMERLIVSGTPAVTAVAIVLLPDRPFWIMRLDGLAAIEKSLTIGANGAPSGATLARLSGTDAVADPTLELSVFFEAEAPAPIRSNAPAMQLTAMIRTRCDRLRRRGFINSLEVRTPGVKRAQITTFPKTIKRSGRAVVVQVGQLLMRKPARS